MTLNRTPASIKGRPCHIFYY